MLTTHMALDPITWAAGVLESAGSPTPRLDATVLRQWLVHESSQRMGHRTVAAAVDGQYEAWVARRAAGEPVAYITGHKTFMGLDLLVDRGVLLPRTLTTAVVEVALELIRIRGESVVAADVGTGSGAVAISLAVHEPLVRLVHATDISGDALAVARRNGERYGLDGRITWLEGDLLAAVPQAVDVVVANLPYVPDPSGEIIGAPRFEPPVAFFGGVAGLDLLERFAAQLPSKLTAGGLVVMEIGPGQRPFVEAALRRAQPGLLIHPPASTEQIIVGELVE
jgi:release factor glutamine methyltransferase